MSIRAVYTFLDDKEIYHVYKHYDGYPSAAIEWIERALENSWKLPRFEACEFAAAFISANKVNRGDICLTHSYKNHGDLEYRYEISNNGNSLIIQMFEMMPYNKEQQSIFLFNGTLEQTKEWIKNNDEHP